MKIIKAETPIIVRSKVNGNVYQLHEYIENHYNYTKPQQMFTGFIIMLDGKVSNQIVELTPEKLEIL